MRRLNVLLPCTLALLLAACSPVTLTGSWRDPEYTGGMPRKVLAIAVSEQDLGRRLLEDEFVVQLQQRGVQALASYNRYSVDQLRDSEGMNAEFRGLGVDKVLVTRLVDKRTELVTSPGTVYGTTTYDRYGHGYYWHDYYRDSWDVVYQPPVTYQVQIITAESKLFDVETGRLIWTGQLETQVGGGLIAQDMAGAVRSFVEIVLEDLEKEGLL